jgi:hypothetical protein
MTKKQNILKEKIHCPECNKLLVKKYISSHIKKNHSKSQYSKNVRKGMRYGLKNKDLLTKSNTEYYCEICNTTIKKKSYYMHIKSLLHKKLLSSFLEQGKANYQNDMNNTKIAINDNDKKRNIKQNLNTKENNYVEYNNLNVNISARNNSDIHSESDERHRKSDNIFRIKLRTETEENKDKYSVSNLSLTIISRSQLSKESIHSKIKFAKISGGFIPKCFEIHRIPTFDDKQEISCENFNKFDSISKSDGFDSYSSSESFLYDKKRYSEDCICDLEERRIKEKVDEIVNKIMKRKH